MFAEIVCEICVTGRRLNDAATREDFDHISITYFDSPILGVTTIGTSIPGENVLSDRSNRHSTVEVQGIAHFQTAVREAVVASCMATG